jgi:hypothetical protein
VRGSLAVLVALVVAGACGPGRLVRRGVVNDDALVVVRDTLPAIRGLEFTRPVPAVALGPDEVRATLAREIEESYAPGELDRLQAVYARLGLLPAGTDLRTAVQHLYAEEGAGFYDPRTKRLILATRALRAGGWLVAVLASLTGRDLVGEFLVAHELTHALQDQHYGLPTEPEPLLHAHGDRRLARQALLEGDATLAGFAYVQRGTPDRETIGWIQRKLHGVPAELAERYPDVPELVRTSLAFQYDAGTSFAGWALAAGGWAAVDRAHRDPPDSTEQILHPARYFATRERPVEVDLGGTDALRASGWKPVLEDTIGELQMRVLAARTLAPERAGRVADGWAGDRLRALGRGDDLYLVWMTVWDSPAEAEEFTAATADILPHAHVERRDARVLALVPPDGTPAATLAPAVWSSTR